MGHSAGKLKEFSGPWVLVDRRSRAAEQSMLNRLCQKVLVETVNTGRPDEPPSQGVWAEPGSGTRAPPPEVLPARAPDFIHSVCWTSLLKCQ